MKNIILLITALFFLTTNTFAAGSLMGSGDSGGGSKEVSGTISDSTQQVLYIGNNQSEIQFVTHPGSNLPVKVQSLRPEEFNDSNILNSVIKSQSTKQWEPVLNIKNLGSQLQNIQNLQNLRMNGIGQ